MRGLGFVLLLCLTLVVAGAAVPHYDINLDLKPFERWREVATQTGPLVDRLAKEALEKRVPRSLLPLIRTISIAAYNFIQEPYRSELTGFAYYGNVSLANIVAMQFLYDFTAFCTSIVCVDSSNRIWHARNFDYGHDVNETKGLQSLTINTSFLQKGKKMFMSSTIAGAIGFFTSVKISGDGFSISINQRNKGTFYENLFAALNMVVTQRKLESIMLRMREIMTTAHSYNQAVAMINSSKFIAPAYIIIGGLTGNQGAVITRAHFRTVDIHTIDEAAGRWYVLETNYDRWTTPPPSDDRRRAAERAMTAMGRQNITSQSLFNVLFAPLVRNNHTVFSTVMSASLSLSSITIP